MAQQKPRVALFVESHEGYGHFNIVSQLIKQLEERGAEVMLLSGTLNYAGAAQTFNMRNARIIHLPLVDYKRHRDGRWQYLTPEREMYDDSPDYIAKRKQAVKEALEHFKPDMVVSELFPFAQAFRKYDMEALDEVSKEQGQAPQRVVLCRDIIHHAHPERVLDGLHTYFDRILVRGDERFCTLTDSQPDWAQITLPTEYTGNFITHMPRRDKDIPDKERHVVAFGGGGYFATDLPFFTGLIRSRKYSQKFGDSMWDIYISENARKHIIPDPQDSSGQKTIDVFSYLERLAREEGQGMIRIFQPIESKKFRKALVNSAMAVARGGYNTTFELFAAEQPQLVIPRDEREQVQRANVLYRHGIAQIYPEYPIPEKHSLNAINDALDDPHRLAQAIDQTPEIQASVPDLNNHGAEHMAERLIRLIERKTDMEKPLRLVLTYQNERVKKRDAETIVGHLMAMGHKVAMVDVQRMAIVPTEAGEVIRQEGLADIPLSGVDGATFYSGSGMEGTQEIAAALRRNHVPVYQDHDMLTVAADKLKSHRVFEEHGIDTPRTYGIDHDEPMSPTMLNGFMDSLGDGPYVVKATRGWNGAQVKVLDSKQEAAAQFEEFHKQSAEKQSGGVLMQHFIESNPERRRDYRIQTVTSINAQGEAVVQIVAAAKRVAQPGMRVTNTSQGADKIRVSLDRDEARAFYVEKHGMDEEEFSHKLASGEIELLSAELVETAKRTALAFGPGSLGIDLIVGQEGSKPYVLEVNPFAGGSNNFEKEHGFSIFKPWAAAFVDSVTHAKTQGHAQEGETRAAQHLQWKKPLKRNPLVASGDEPKRFVS